MANAIAKIRKEVVSFGSDFVIDPSTETIISVEDNKDSTFTILIVSYIRKGNGP